MDDVPAVVDRLVRNALDWPSHCLDSLVELEVARRSVSGIQPLGTLANVGAAIDAMGAGDSTGILEAVSDLDSEVATNLVHHFEALADVQSAEAIDRAMAGLGEVPTFRILLSLLVRTGADRAVRIVDDLRRTYGEKSDQWTSALYEAEMSAVDAGVPLAEPIARSLREVDDRSWDEVALAERVIGHLRRSARDPAAELLEQFDDAYPWAPAINLDFGYKAVFARLGHEVQSTLAHLSTLSDLGIDGAVKAARHLAWEASNPADLEAPTVELAAQLEKDLDAGLSHRHDQWSAFFDLLALTARIGSVSLLDRLCERLDPPSWCVMTATWSEVRKSGDAEVRAAIWKRLRSRPADGARCRVWVPVAPPWADLPRQDLADLWLLKSEDIEGMPWFTPWGAGLP